MKIKILIKKNNVIKWLLLIMILLQSTLYAQYSWTKILNGKIASNLALVPDTSKSILLAYYEPGISDEQIFGRINEDGELVQRYYPPNPVFYVVTNPTDSSVFYTSSMLKFFRTSDGGSSWVDIGSSFLNGMEDILSSAFVVLGNPDILLVGKGGMYISYLTLRSDNQGESWDTLSSPGTATKAATSFVHSKTVPNRILMTTNPADVYAYDLLTGDIHSILDSTSFPLTNVLIYGINPIGDDTTETYLVGAYPAGGLDFHLLTLEYSDQNREWTILKTFDIDSTVVRGSAIYQDQIYLYEKDFHHNNEGRIRIIGSHDSGQTWYYMDMSGLDDQLSYTDIKLWVDARMDNGNLYISSEVGLFKASLPLAKQQALSIGFSNSGYSEEQSDIHIYPNPVNGSMSIKLGANYSPINRIEIFNTLGQQVATFDYNFNTTVDQTIRLDLSSLQSGVYVMRLFSGAMLKTSKFTLLK